MKSNILWILSILLFVLVFACSKEGVMSSEKEVVSFSIGDLKSNAEGTIDKEAKTVTLQGIAGVDVANLVPIIKVSDKAKISPESGIAQDFTNPVTYTVIAEDGSRQQFVVTVLPPKSSEKQILTFNFAGLKPNVVGTIDQDKKSVVLTVPLGTDVKSLVPSITLSKKSSVTPAADVMQDFTKPVVYTVTAEDGSKQEYTVTVKVEATKSSEKKITAFKFSSLSTATVSIDEAAKTISVVAPAGSDVSALVPTITLSAGASVAPSQDQKQNFSKPVVYTVTAEDGSKQEYTVTVKVEATKSSEKKITAFKFSSLSTATVSIDEAAKTISVVAPAGSDVSALAPTITLSAGASVAPSQDQKQNFSKPVVYTVTAEDGSKQEYTVTVKVEATKSSEKKITAFKFSSLSTATVSIDEAAKTISVVAPAGSDVSALVPTITLSAGASVAPSQDQKQDFSKPVVYTVTAEDGSKQEYTVTVKVEATKSSEKKITEFKFAGLSPVVVATVNETNKTIKATLYSGVDIKALTPTITLSDKATISPASGVSVDFSSPVTFTVTAEDGTTATYTASVEVVKNTEAKILDYTIKALSVSGVINEDKKSITLSVPYGTDITALTPTIKISTNAAVTPATGVKVNLTSPATYKVVSESGSTVFYTVSANVQSFETKITSVSSSKVEPRDNLKITGLFMKGQTSVALEGAKTVALTISDESTTSLMVIVPDGIDPGNYTLAVTSNGIKATYSPIIVMATTKPTIDRINETTLPEGNELIMYGKNLNKTANKIVFDMYNAMGHTTVTAITFNSDGTEAHVILPTGVLYSKSSDKMTASIQYDNGYEKTNYFDFTLVKKPTITGITSTSIFIGDYLEVSGNSLVSSGGKIWLENKSTSAITLIPAGDVSEYAGLIRIKTQDLVAGEYTVHIISYGNELSFDGSIVITRGKTAITDVPSAVWSNKTLNVAGQYIYKDIVVKIDGTECTYTYVSSKKIIVNVPKLWVKNPVIQFLQKNANNKYDLIYSQKLYNND